MTEAVCLLTYLLRAWRVEPLLLNGEDLEGWQERVLDAETKITLSNNSTSLRFIPRTSVKSLLVMYRSEIENRDQLRIISIWCNVSRECRRHAHYRFRE